MSVSMTGFSNTNIVGSRKASCTWHVLLTVQRVSRMVYKTCMLVHGTAKLPIETTARCRSVEIFLRQATDIFGMNPYKKKIILAYYVYRKLKKEEKRKKRFWIHPILEKREEFGAFHTLVKYQQREEMMKIFTIILECRKWHSINCFKDYPRN